METPRPLRSATDSGSTSTPRRRASTAWFGPFYAACIIALSLQAILSLNGLRSHHAWVAALEIIGALLLIVRRSRIVGLVILLLVFTLAGVITVRSGHIPLYLMLYAGTAVLVAQLAAAPSGCDSTV